ncbi:histidine triad (HIT) protein [Deinococcus aluminii]|uniref:HIT domain-containing protein n=1 Tax=Deinococcus aluminii TaxID=1656885 RepID=A0ABP9XH24_9DEIO
MKVTVNLDGTLLPKREEEWAHWLAHPDENPLVPDTAGRPSGEGWTIQNDLGVYSQRQPQYAEGLRYSGIIVTKRPCQTVFDLTPGEAAAPHALLAEVRAHLDATVQPDGYKVGGNVYPAGGQPRPDKYSPRVHLHVIPRWNTDVSAGAGLRHFLKEAAREAERRCRTATSAPPDPA